jgi:hypothetical protein
MPRKQYKPEEIVAKLRQVDVLTSQPRAAFSLCIRHVFLGRRRPGSGKSGTGHLLSSGSDCMQRVC